MKIALSIIISLFMICSLFSQDTIRPILNAYIQNGKVNKESYVKSSKYVIIKSNDSSIVFKNFFHNTCAECIYSKKTDGIYIVCNSDRQTVVNRQFPLKKNDTTTYLENWCNPPEKPTSDIWYKCVYKGDKKIKLYHKKINCFKYELYHDDNFYSKRIIYVRKKDFIVLRDEKYVSINEKYSILGEEEVAFPALFIYAPE